jgi:hypothetical protein
VRGGEEPAFAAFASFAAFAAAEPLGPVCDDFAGENFKANILFLPTERDGDIYMTAPIPEPATWALMLAGFGLVGVAVRRGRRRRGHARG